jgi:hypothetical protein
MSLYATNIPGILAEAERNRIESQQESLWVFGFFSYRDFMRDVYDVGFCVRWDLTVGGPMPHTPFGFVADGPQNYTYTRKNADLSDST